MVIGWFRFTFSFGVYAESECTLGVRGRVASHSRASETPTQVAQVTASDKDKENDSRLGALGSELSALHLRHFVLKTQTMAEGRLKVENVKKLHLRLQEF